MNDFYNKSIIIAPDSFKGSITSIEAADAIEKGFASCGFTNITKIPMADGGEGTLDALICATGGRYINIEVCDPICRTINAKYGILGDGTTGVIEMAQASGIMLLKEDELNPYITSTYGTGQLILDAIDKGCKKIIIGIGGSATNDGGAGMAVALGAKMLDIDLNPLPPGGLALANLHSIDLSNFMYNDEIEIVVACDVNNPLCGDNGASYIYGPQKGADIDMVKALDNALSNYANVIYNTIGKSIINLAGAGAAGGLGGGLYAFISAKLLSGIDIVCKATNIESLIEDSYCVITGEGMSDEQTCFGKVPAGIAKIGKKYNKDVICISGGLGESYEKLYDIGITSCLSICDMPMSLENSMNNASKLLENCARAVARIYASKK